MSEPLTSKTKLPSAKDLVDALARFADHNELCPRGQWKPQDEEDFDMPACTCGLELLLDHANVFVQQYPPAEPVAPSSPPADPDPEPSRADKLRAALKLFGVKVTVLGEADEPKTVLPPAKQGRQRLGEIPADASTACESREAGEAAGGSTVPPPKIANRDEAIERLEQQKENLLNALEAKQARIDALMLEYCPGEMSASQRAAWSASQELASVPPAASQVEEVLCAGVVVSSPHDRRITLRFETDEQFRAAEVLIGIADCQVIDTAVTKEEHPKSASTSGRAPSLPDNPRGAGGNRGATDAGETEGARAGHYYSPRPGTEVCFICGFHRREHAPEHFFCPRCSGSKIDPEPVMRDFGNGPEAQPQPCVACSVVSEEGPL